MTAHLPGGVAESLHLRDLLALQPHEAGEHRIHHEGGDAQKDHRIGQREHADHFQLIIEPFRTGMVRSRVAALAAKGLQHAVQLLDHRFCRRAGREVDAQIIEGTVEIEGHGDGALVHPEDAKAFVIRERLSAACLKHEFRRKRDAAEPQFLAPAIDHGDDAVAYAELVRDGEGFAHHGLIARVRAGQAAFAEEKLV